MDKKMMIEFAKEQSVVFPEDSYMGEYLRETLKMLQAEPCEDTVSREDVIKAIDRHTLDADDGLCLNEDISIILEELPPIPQPKKRHWIEKAEDYYKAINEYGGGVDENTDYFTDDIACPKCLSKFSTIDNETERFRHCPNCGAWMVEPQEGKE